MSWSICHARTPPFRAIVVTLLGSGCEAVTAQGFSSAYRGTFAHQGEVRCLEVPEPPGTYQVTLAPGDANPPMVQLIQNQHARMCTTTATAAVTDVQGCEVRIPQPNRLIVALQDPQTTGNFQVAGAVEGDGTPWLSVYDDDGNAVCHDRTAAAYQQIGCKLGNVPHMVVVRSATGSGQYRIGQVTGISASCSTPVSTAFGAPATVGEIGISGDIRCYRAPANSWVGVQDGGDVPTIRYFDDQGGLYTAVRSLSGDAERALTPGNPAHASQPSRRPGWGYLTSATREIPNATEGPRLF